MIDWSQCILNIRNETGNSVSTIARKIDSTERHLNRIVRSEVAEPKFSKGLQLLDLHLDACGIDKHRELLG